MAWSRVQAGVVHDNSGGGLTNTATFGVNITAGNLVPGACQWGTAVTTDLSSVTSGAATATIKSRVADTTNSQSFATFYFINHPGGVATVVQNMASSITALQITVGEFTNTGVSTATNSGGSAQVQGSPGTGTDAVKTGSTFGASGDLIWGSTMADGVASQTVTSGTGYTTDLVNNSDPNLFSVSSRTEWQAATGAADTTFTVTPNGSMLTGGMSFTPGGGGRTISAADTIANFTDAAAFTNTDHITAAETIGALASSAAFTNASHLASAAAFSTFSSAAVLRNGSAPVAPLVIPHDDYEPWYRRRNDYTSRLDAMRREIGVIPKEAQRAVAKAATVILAKPQAARTEAKAFDLVKHYEAAFKRALRDILGRLRAEDIEAAWKEQVRRSLVERAEEEELILIAQWLL